jgi:hypothetical protein
MNKIKLIMLGFIFFMFANSCTKDDYKNLDCSTVPATFLADVRPIINSNCVSSGCHPAGSGHGDFTSFAGIKGKVNNGSFAKEVLVNKTMPSQGTLSLSDRQKLKCWIDNGALEN